MDCLRRKRLWSKIFEKKYSDEYIYTAFKCGARSARKGPTAWFKNFFEKYSVQLDYIIPSPVTSGGGSALQPLRFCN